MEKILLPLIIVYVFMMLNQYNLYNEKRISVKSFIESNYLLLISFFIVGVFQIVVYYFL